MGLHSIAPYANNARSSMYINVKMREEGVDQVRESLFPLLNFKASVFIYIFLSSPAGLDYRQQNQSLDPHFPIRCRIDAVKHKS